MKLVSLLFVLSLTGCSIMSTPGKGEIPSITSQTFNTKVPGERIKIEKSCGWLQRDKCSIESIEAVGVQPSVGATRLLQKSTTLLACDNARANIVGYVFGTNVNESRSSRIKNVQNENQKDRVKYKTEIGQDVDMSADDSNKDTNYSVREALINTDIDTVRNITTNSQGKLVGFSIKDTVVLDTKTVACTIVWNKNDSEDLKKVRGLISGQ